MEDISIIDSDEVETTYVPSSDTDKPIINIKEKTYTIKANDNIDFLNSVTATDATEGDITYKIKSNINELDFSKVGIKKVEYSVSDNAGNTTSEVVYVTVKNDNTNLIRLGQLGLLLISILVLVLLYKYIKSLILEKRFSRYTINSSKNKSISLLDNLYNQYIDFINKLGIYLLRFNFINKKSKKYNKYETAFNIKGIDFISKKIVIGFAFIVFTIIIELLQSKIATSLEMLISFIIGFFAYDILYKYKYNKYKAKIESDMLDAIVIMNNGFKSGMSITQAIELVSKEISGPISKEFKKINLDIKMGLGVDVAFKRFSKRVNSDEAIYLSSSLSVLNKTGGNIIKVFNSIEKNMFNRKKLVNELKSLTSSSKLIMYVLMLVPPIFIVFISLINKEYFEPLFSNILGNVLLVIMCLIYITYIVIVRKVLNIKIK